MSLSAAAVVVVTTIPQLLVFRTAEIPMIEVAVYTSTDVRYHAVPSFVIAQVCDPAAVLVSGKNKFKACAVFGVLVWYLNVTVLLSALLHAPVKVQILNTLGV